MPLNTPDQPGNPYYEIHQILKELESAAEFAPELAVARVKDIIDSYIGHGISRKNAMRFKRDLDQALEEGRRGHVSGKMAVIKVIYDHLLGGWGMGVTGVRRENAEIATIANLINEDGEVINLPPMIREIIRNANNHGFVVEAFYDGTGPEGEGPMTGRGMGTCPDEIPDLEAGMFDVPGEEPIAEPSDVETERMEYAAFEELLAWAQANGCPPEICERARLALASEGEEAGIEEPSEVESEVPMGGEPEVAMGRMQ